MPWGIMPDDFNVGSNAIPMFSGLVISKGAVTWCLFIGIIFIISAVIQFVDRKTTVNPTKPYKTTTLVITGTYKITRNPMYLGMLLIIISFAFFVVACSNHAW